MADRRDSDPDDPPTGIVRQKKEFLESFFEKGAEFTRELLRENDRLRHRVSELEEQLRHGVSLGPAQIAQIDRQLAERYAEIERENNALASLFVAQSQIHSSLRFDQVVEVILEVLLNFVGCKDFAVFERGEAGLRLLADHGEPPAGAADDPLVHHALEGRSHYADTVEQVSARPQVCFPLRYVDGAIGGVVCVWSFLPQKSGVEDIDRRMFDLISESGGLALQAARAFEANRSR